MHLFRWSRFSASEKSTLCSVVKIFRSGKKYALPKTTIRDLGQVEVQLGFSSLNFNFATMDLSPMYLCCSSCNFSSRPPRSSPSSSWLLLIDLGLGLIVLELSQRWSTLCNLRQVHLCHVEVFNLASMDLIGVRVGPPRATPMTSNFGLGEVQLGFASWDFNLTKI